MKILLLLLIIFINILPNDFVAIKTSLMSAFMFLWISFVFSYLWYLQRNRMICHQKEENLYIKEIPKLRTVSELYYLLNKKIDADALGTSLMELVRKDVLLLRYNPKNDDYIFIYNPNFQEKISFAEKNLLDWLLSKIGNGERVSLSLIKKDAYTNSAYFLSCYDDWKNLASIEGTKPTFFETTSGIIDSMIGYISLSIFLAFLSLYDKLSPLVTISSLVSTFILILYINSFYLRTKEGNSEYYRWLSFKESIKNGEACNNITNISSLEKVIIYAKILKTIPDNMITTISTNKTCDLDNSDFIRYSKAGVVDDICSKMKKYVSRALSISFVFSRNKGSKANVKYKRKEGI